MRDARLSRAATLRVLAVAAAVLAALALYVALGAPFARQELAMIAWSQAAAGPVVAGWLGSLSAVHSTPWVMGATGLVALVLSSRREFAVAGWFLAVVPGGALLNHLLKHVFERLRPGVDALASGLGDFAFPSGHAANSTLFYGALVLLLASRASSGAARAVVACLGVAMALAVAASRVVLGAHFPTDVVAGIAGALAWLALCTLLTNRP